MKFSSFVIGLFFYLNVVNADDSIRIPSNGGIGYRPACNTFRCSLVPDPVYATDGVKCYVFVNPCLLGLENCHRNEAGLTSLEVIDKEKCQTLCKPECPKCDKPVCGYRDGILLDFPGLCWLEYYNCKTGQVYILNNEGPCRQ